MLQFIRRQSQCEQQYSRERIFEGDEAGCSCEPLVGVPRKLTMNGSSCLSWLAIFERSRVELPFCLSLTKTIDGAPAVDAKAESEELSLLWSRHRRLGLVPAIRRSLPVLNAAKDIASRSDSEWNKVKDWLHLAETALRKDHKSRHEANAIPLQWRGFRVKR